VRSSPSDCTVMQYVTVDFLTVELTVDFSNLLTSLDLPTNEKIESKVSLV
jgi:hypothetical protein